MQLREGEKILKTYRRHLFPMIVLIIEVLLGSVPFYLLIYFMMNNVSLGTLSVIIGVVTAIFSLLLLNVVFNDRLDKLVVTNHRIIMVDWKVIVFKSESEIDIKDIQEITLTTAGILANLKIFDFGTCLIETASHDLSIRFDDAPHPSEMRDFILSLKGI